MLRKRILVVSVAVSLTASVQAAFATDWVTDITAVSSNYAGTTGTITFNDWGYTGPGGVGANDFQVGSGFDSNNLGQVQHVITKAPDLLTSDPSKKVFGDLTNTPVYTNASMDGQVNFYKWAYTTPTNSTFSNMQIDRAGNYHVAKSDMAFGFYDTFNYHDTTGTYPDDVRDTAINFQPYAISDAKGWCGSTLVSNPNGVATMAGQVTFDFAFDAYFEDFSNPTAPGNYSSTQLVPGFVMRSYGDYTFSLKTSTGDNMNYVGHAVGNNTNPTSVVAGIGGTLDPAYLNEVSFLGGGVVPNGVWTSADSYNPDGSRKLRTSHNPTTGVDTQVWDVTIVPEGTPGAVWHGNSFAGYAYLLRADANRTLEWISPDGHSIYTSTDPAAYASLAAVPVPAAVWLFGSGLLGLAGAARRKKTK